MTNHQPSQAEAMRRFRKAATGDLLIWFVLLGLGAVSFFAAFQPLGRFDLVASLAVAVIQVALLGLFFMHLRHARVLIVLTALSASVFVMAMFALTLNDLFTRV